MAVFLCLGCHPPLPSNSPSWLGVKLPCPAAQYAPFRAGNCIPSLAPLVPLYWHSRHSPVGPSSPATLLAPPSLSKHHKGEAHHPPSLPLLLTWSFLCPLLILFPFLSFPQSPAIIFPFLITAPFS